MGLPSRGREWRGLLFFVKIATMCFLRLLSMVKKTYGSKKTFIFFLLGPEIFPLCNFAYQMSFPLRDKDIAVRPQLDLTPFPGCAVQTVLPSANPYGCRYVARLTLTLLGTWSCRECGEVHHNQKDFVLRSNPSHRRRPLHDSRDQEGAVFGDVQF